MPTHSNFATHRYAIKGRQAEEDTRKAKKQIRESCKTSKLSDSSYEVEEEENTVKVKCSHCTRYENDGQGLCMRKYCPGGN